MILKSFDQLKDNKAGVGDKEEDKAFVLDADF